MSRTRAVFASTIAVALIGTFASCSDDSDTKVIGSDSSSEDAATSDGDGDGDESSGTDDAADLEVRSGFTTGVDSIGTRYTSAGAWVINPNDDVAAYDVQVLFNVIDAKGDVLDSQTENVPYVGPGASVPVAPLQIGFDLKKEPTKLEVQAVGDFSTDEGPRGQMGGDAAILTVKSARLQPGEYGTELSAQVTNPTDTVAEFASWSCIYLQGDRIVGGQSSTIVDPIPPGSTVEFSDMLTIDLKASKVECQVITDL